MLSKQKGNLEKGVWENVLCISLSTYLVYKWAPLELYLVVILYTNILDSISVRNYVEQYIIFHRELFREFYRTLGIVEIVLT